MADERVELIRALMALYQTPEGVELLAAVSGRTGRHAVGQLV
jgi:hypothetical protein